MNGFHILERKEYQVNFQHICNSVHTPNLDTQKVNQACFTQAFFVCAFNETCVQTLGLIHVSLWRRGPAHTGSLTEKTFVCPELLCAPMQQQQPGCLHGQALGILCPGSVDVTSPLLDLFLNGLKRQQGCLFLLLKYS